MLEPTLITGPTTPLVTVADLKKYSEIFTSDNDELLQSLISAAMAKLDGYEGILGRALINQTWRIQLDAWRCREIELPLGRVHSATVTYYPADGSPSTAFDGSNFSVYNFPGGRAIVELLADKSFPGAANRRDAVSVEYVVGYGPNVSDVPADITLAIKRLCAHIFENREEVVVGTVVAKLPWDVMDLIWSHRLNVVTIV